MKQIKDYMKKKVVYFKPEDSIFKVAKVLSKHHISGAPVVKNRKVVGVISESDIIKFMRFNLPQGEEITHEPHILTLLIISMVKDHIIFKKELQRISKVLVKELMSKDVISIDTEENIVEAASMMEEFGVERLPVINKGRLVGIIARSDLIRALIE